MTTDTVSVPGTSKPSTARRRPRAVVVVLLIMGLLLVGGAGRAWWLHHTSDVRYGTEVVSAEGMAARYGVELNLVAVTAAGGLVELRYQVVDPDKANPILHDPDLAPALVAEDTGQTLVMRKPPHRHGELRLGATYFFLLANTRNALRPGSPVTLVIGDARLEHVTVQG